MDARTESRMRKQVETLRAQLYEAEQARKTAEESALVGNCYKYQNCYSCPEDPSDYWMLYTKVIRMESGEAGTIRFEVDKYGNAEIKKESGVRTSCLGSQIGTAEFAEATQAFQRRVTALLAALSQEPQ